VRVAITGGAGGVGSSVAFNLLLHEHPYEVLLFDNRPNMIASHAMDLEQVLEQDGTGSVRGGEAGELADADLVVATAAAPLTVNSSRMVYLGDNAAILEALLAELPEDWGGILILVTNPVDPLATWAARRVGIARERLLGYTLNDSLRLRTAIASELGVEPGRVEAWVVGEHGDGSVALFERVLVDGEPVALDAAARARAIEFLRTWYRRHVALDSGRSSTWTSGRGLARMVEAIRSDSGELWPASVVLDGEYGIEGVSLGVPVRLGRGGAEEVVDWELEPVEAEALRDGAATVREAAAEIGSPGTESSRS
jgi:malate/lactate dehydrogenase